MQYLSTEQALADFSYLIRDFKERMNATDSAVIAFGGSYGGMLASWWRLKYPWAVDGAIAASAPIWSFEGEDPAYDEGSYAKIVTRDASAAGGASDACAENIRSSWDDIFNSGSSDEGRARLAARLSLCQKPAEDDIYTLAYWLQVWPGSRHAFPLCAVLQPLFALFAPSPSLPQSAFDYMSMGNYPYPTSYITNGNGMLPAFPMRVACASLADDTLDADGVLEGMAQAVGVYYNNSGSLQCFDFTQGVNPDSDADANYWGYQYCTEMVQPFSRGTEGSGDMFFS